MNTTRFVVIGLAILVSASTRPFYQLSSPLLHRNLNQGGPSRSERSPDAHLPARRTATAQAEMNLYAGCADLGHIGRDGRSQMTTLARAISKAFSDSENGISDALLKQLLLAAAAVLLVAALTLTYGLDLSPGLF
ncbi:hypothetical protein [Bradyrhizobium sp. USDA 4353]